MQYDVLTVPGIGEAESTTGPIGMLKGFTDALPARFVEKKQFNWRNQYGPLPVWNGPAYDDNVAAAVSDLVLAIQARTRPTLLVGYSGGAHVASLAAAQNPTNLVAVAFVSNPSRRRGDSPSPFYGITGERPPTNAQVFDIANPADVICCCPESQPLRDFYDITGHFSLADPDAWGKALWAKAVNRQLTNSARRASLSDWWLMIAYARGYMFDGQHTKYYTPKMAGFAATVASALS